MTLWQGWLRLWLLITAALVAWFGWSASKDINIQMETGSSWYCIPGSYESHVESQPDGDILPSQAAIDREIGRLKQIGDSGNDMELSMVASANLTRSKYRDVTLFQCVSYGHLFGGVLKGLLLSICVCLSFMMIRWVANGFRRKV